MKILILFLILFSTNFIAFSQSDKNIKCKDVPTAVKEFIKKNYPEAEKINYYTEKQGDSSYYEATFKHRDDRYTLMISKEGKLYETEVIMSYEELPALIKDKITSDLKTRFSRFTIKKVEQINPDHKLKYKVTIRGKEGHHKGYFDAYYDGQGNFIEVKQETLKSIPSNSGF